MLEILTTSEIDFAPMTQLIATLTVVCMLTAAMLGIGIKKLFQIMKG